MRQRTEPDQLVRKVKRHLDNFRPPSSFQCLPKKKVFLPNLGSQLGKKPGPVLFWEVDQSNSTGPKKNSLCPAGAERLPASTALGLPAQRSRELPTHWHLGTFSWKTTRSSKLRHRALKCWLPPVTLIAVVNCDSGATIWLLINKRPPKSHAFSRDTVPYKNSFKLLPLKSLSVYGRTEKDGLLGPPTPP